MSPVFAADGPSMVWAEFRSASVSTSGAPVNAIALAEKPGDVSSEPLVLAGSAVRVAGRIARGQGSQWSTLGLAVPANAANTAVNLSGYQSLRIRLASNAARNLRIRLKGPDVKTQKEGCYPVVFQRVAASAELEIPLEAFEPEPYCGPRGASIAQTLPAVVQVEVTANDAADEPVIFDVGRIEFVKTGATSHLASAAPPPPASASRPAAWKLAWSDEFNAPSGAGIDEKRWLNNKVPGTTVPVHDGNGHLVLTAPFSMQMRYPAALTHGRVELRAKLPLSSAVRVSLRGAPLTALNWPEEGEITLLDNEGADTHVGVYAPGIDEDAAYQAALSTAQLQDGFHTIVLEWDPKQLRWQLDGATVKTVAMADMPPAARESFEHWPFLLRIEMNAGSTTPWVVDHLRVFQNDELAAAHRARMAPWLAAHGKGDAVLAAAAPRPAAKPAAPRRAAPTEAPAPVTRRVVTCERNKFGLMMCY
ncbi:glycoside hydrolase family 16 protein [Piscinibacter terrae]|nr:family 16 glycosylhydrolase [Albitalea terrae]